MMTSKLRTDYKSTTAKKMLSAGTAAADSMTALLNLNVDLARFHGQPPPTAKEIAEALGEKRMKLIGEKGFANYVTMFQQIAVDHRLTFEIFLKAFWGMSHLAGADFRNPLTLQSYAASHDIDVHILGKGVVFIGFNHPIASIEPWPVFVEIFNEFEAVFFGEGEFVMPEAGSIPAGSPSGKIDISRLH